MKIILTVFALFFRVALFAQETADRAPRHQFEVQAAYVFGYWKDIMFSPLNYQAQGALYQVDYQRENRNGEAIFKVAIDAGVGQIMPVRPDLSRFTADYIAGNLTLGYLKRIPGKSDKLCFFLGPQYRLNVSYYDYQGQDSFTFIASHTLDADALLRYAISARHAVSTSASVGLLGLLVRPPYAGYDTRLLNNYENHPLRLIVDGGRFASLLTYQLIDWRATYRFALTSRLNLSLHYGFSYQRVHDRFHPFVQALNQVGGGISLNL